MDNKPFRTLERHLEAVALQTKVLALEDSITELAPDPTKATGTTDKRELLIALENYRTQCRAMGRAGHEIIHFDVQGKMDVIRTILSEVYQYNPKMTEACIASGIDIPPDPKEEPVEQSSLLPPEVMKLIDQLAKLGGNLSGVLRSAIDAQGAPTAGPDGVVEKPRRTSETYSRIFTKVCRNLIPMSTIAAIVDQALTETTADTPPSEEIFGIIDKLQENGHVKRPEAALERVIHRLFLDGYRSRVNPEVLQRYLISLVQLDKVTLERDKAILSRITTRLGKPSDPEGIDLLTTQIKRFEKLVETLEGTHLTNTAAILDDLFVK